MLSGKSDIKALKKFNLGFFLTKMMSLAEWSKAGILSREIKPYNLLANYFNKIYLFSYGGEEELQYKKYLAANIEIIYRKTNWWRKFYSYLLPFVNKHYIKKCHIIKSNQMRGIEALLLSKLFINKRTKFILRTGYTLSFVLEQENLPAKSSLFWEKIAYNNCDLALVSSESDKEYLIAKHNLNNLRILVFPNIVDIDVFYPQKQVIKYEDRIVFVGRISREKNLLNLVKALKGTSIQLDLIGAGPLKNLLIKEAQRLGVKINFLGLVDNEKLPLVLNKYKIFVLPSFYEGMPKALLEAMACGLACISSDVRNIREVIRHKQTGILVKTDPASIRNGILSLFQQPELQHKLSVKARDFIVKNFSLKEKILTELEIYHNLLCP